MGEEYKQVLAIINRLDEDVVRGEEENKKIAEEICSLFESPNKVASTPISLNEDRQRYRYGVAENDLHDAVVGMAINGFTYYNGFNTPTTTLQVNEIHSQTTARVSMSNFLPDW